MKLEVGKKYVCRNGEVVGPIEEGDQSRRHNFRGRVPFKNYEYMTWTENGIWDDYVNLSEFDIVSEYTKPTPPLQWKWMKPDRPGIWAWGGSRRDERVCFKISNLSKPSEETLERLEEIYAEGWWCFICDIPFIAEPTKQRVMKHLWVRRSGDGPRDIETEWSEKCPGDNWYCSSLAEEFLE